MKCAQLRVAAAAASSQCVAIGHLRTCISVVLRCSQSQSPPVIHSCSGTRRVLFAHLPFHLSTVFYGINAEWRSSL